MTRIRRLGSVLGAQARYGIFCYALDVRQQFCLEVERGREDPARSAIALEFVEPEFNLIEPGADTAVCSGAERAGASPASARLSAVLARCERGCHPGLTAAPRVQIRLEDERGGNPISDIAAPP